MQIPNLLSSSSRCLPKAPVYLYATYPLSTYLAGSFNYTYGTLVDTGWIEAASCSKQINKNRETSRLSKKDTPLLPPPP